MDFDVGDAPFETSEPLPDLLLDLGIAFGVAGKLVVGMDLDEHLNLR